jgi:hypothetical protein
MRRRADMVDVEQAKVGLDALIRDHEAEQRKREHIEALQEERRYVEGKLAHALAIGPDGSDRLEIPISNPSGHGHYLIDRTGAQLRAEAEASIRAIDVEIARVERDGVPDPRAADPPAGDLSMTRFAAIEVR